MKALAEELRAEVDRAAARLRGTGEADAARSRGAGKWVKKEILGHLIDSAANNHQRFVRAQLADRYDGPEYDQEAWVAVHRYRERSWPDLVDLWVALNRHVVAVMEAAPAASLATPCVIGGGEPHPLEWVMRDYLRHLRHHLEQLGASPGPSTTTT